MTNLPKGMYSACDRPISGDSLVGDGTGGGSVARDVGKNRRGERWRGAAELGTERLMVAPVAQLARPRPPVARVPGSLDGLPQRRHLTLGGEQVGLVGGVTQYLTLGEVHELQQPWHLAAQAPDHQRVELHLEQRAGLVRLPGRAAGLVVHDPDVAAGCHVKAV